MSLIYQDGYEMNENWMPIENCPYYQVSNLGRISSMPRTTMRCNGRPLKVGGRILKLFNSGSYLVFEAYGRNIYVAHSVALAFIVI